MEKKERARERERERENNIRSICISKYFFIHHHLLIFHYDTEYVANFYIPFLMFNQKNAYIHTYIYLWLNKIYFPPFFDAG